MNLKKIVSLAILALSTQINAQLFRTKDRIDNLQDFDEQKFSWGFFLAGNYFDYKLVLDPKYGMKGNQNAITSKGSAGFGAGLIGKMRINPNLDLRLEPSLQFVQRDITFDTSHNTGATVNYPALPTFPQKNTVKSTYVDIPLLLEFHGDRWYNSRPYVAGGVNYLLNLQSNETSPEDNQQGTFRTTSHNFGLSAEMGIQFYFSRFKLTPAVRGTFFLNNEIVKDNPTTPPYWAAGISSAQTRAFMFVLKFE